MWFLLRPTYSHHHRLELSLFHFCQLQKYRRYWLDTCRPYLNTILSRNFILKSSCRYPIQASDLSAAATNGYYYTYIHGSWALSATMESDKYLAANAVSDGGQSSTRFELGNDLTLNANLGGGIAGATCGNNLKETGETCDGTDLNSQTCATQLGVGYTGTLSCNADCLSFNTSACTYQIPTSGLVGYWKFDDGSGTSASDSSGNGYTGTLYNGASWTSGKVNGALNFDSSLISAVDQPLPSLAASSISISLWVYRTTLPMDGWWDALASRWYWSGITARQYQLVLASPEVMSPYTSEVNWMVSTDCSNTPNIWSVTTISLNTWTHILVTYDKTTGVANIYINGQLDKTGSFGTAGLCSNLGSYPQQVGAKRDSIGGALNQPYGGKIDEVAVYNRALTADEALAIYNGQK